MYRIYLSAFISFKETDTIEIGVDTRNKHYHFLAVIKSSFHKIKGIFQCISSLIPLIFPGSTFLPKCFSKNFKRLFSLPVTVLFQKLRIIFQICDSSSCTDILSSLQKPLLLLFLTFLFQIKNIILQPPVPYFQMAVLFSGAFSTSNTFSRTSSHSMTLRTACLVPENRRLTTLIFSSKDA